MIVGVSENLNFDGVGGREIFNFDVVV